ncbi:AAA family ATPase [Adhaeribacter aquaticus]|uniref:AAA family ATPase n=1 Tax=Adhaeribacter aquaticus TaxID=299567 RepID=UPI00047C3F85|nr:AAA family ATPase [Adhaeribacter aquaticus]
MQAIIFCGIQATGKSTFYKDYFFNTHVRISLDLLRTRNRERIFLQSCLQTGQRFVVDNTNPTAVERKRYIDVAKEAKYEVIGYFFESNTQEAVVRNSNRTGKEKIPDVGIYGTRKRLEIPSYSEGFDSLFYVHIKELGRFSVREWQQQ